jgi:hypothetical protein
MSNRKQINSEEDEDVNFLKNNSLRSLGTYLVNSQKDDDCYDSTSQVQTVGIDLVYLQIKHTQILQSGLDLHLVGVK